MIISMLKAPKTSAPPRDFAQYLLPHQKILRTALSINKGWKNHRTGIVQLLIQSEEASLSTSSESVTAGT